MLILRDGTQESVLEHFSSDACTRSDHATDIMPGAGIDGSVKLPLGLARRTKRVFDCTVPRRNRNASRRFTSYARTYRPDPRISWWSRPSPPYSWSALRADLSRDDSHVHVDQPGHSDAQECELETAATERPIGEV